MGKTKTKNTRNTYVGKKSRFPTVEEAVERTAHMDSDTGAETPNQDDLVSHSGRTEPSMYELSSLLDGVSDQDSSNSEIEGAVGGSDVKTHPDKRVEGVKVIIGAKKCGFVPNSVIGAGQHSKNTSRHKHDDDDDDDDEDDDDDDDEDDDDDDGLEPSDGSDSELKQGNLFHHDLDLEGRYESKLDRVKHINTVKCKNMKPESSKTKETERLSLKAKPENKQSKLNDRKIDERKERNNNYIPRKGNVEISEEEFESEEDKKGKSQKKNTVKQNKSLVTRYKVAQHTQNSTEGDSSSNEPEEITDKTQLDKRLRNQNKHSNEHKSSVTVSGAMYLADDSTEGESSLDEYVQNMSRLQLNKKQKNKNIELFINRRKDTHNVYDDGSLTDEPEGAHQLNDIFDKQYFNRKRSSQLTGSLKSKGTSRRFYHNGLTGRDEHPFVPKPILKHTSRQSELIDTPIQIDHKRNLNQKDWSWGDMANGKKRLEKERYQDKIKLRNKMMPDWSSTDSESEDDKKHLFNDSKTHESERKIEKVNGINKNKHYNEEAQDRGRDDFIPMRDDEVKRDLYKISKSRLRSKDTDRQDRENLDHDRFNTGTTCKRDLYRDYLCEEARNRGDHFDKNKLKIPKYDWKAKNPDTYRCPRDKRFSSQSSDSDTPKHENFSFNRSIKPPSEKYNGNGPFDIFIARLEDYAKLNGWNKEEMALILRTSLTGPAALLLSDSTQRYKSYDELKRALEIRFGTHSQSAMYRAKIRQLRRKPGQSIQDLFSDFCSLMHQAYPDKGLEDKESMTIDYFLIALDDPSLESRIRDREPKSLLDAYNLAVRLSSYDPSTYSFEGNRGQNKRKEWGQNVNVVKENSPSYERYEEEIKLLKEAVRNLTEKSKRENSTRNKVPPGRQGPPTCYVCSEIGHKSFQCPNRNKGHKVQEQNQEAYATLSTLRSKYDRPYLEAEYRGDKWNCLLDTGCCFSTIPYDLIRNKGIQVHPDSEILFDAKDSKVDVMGRINILLKINQVILPCSFLVSRDIKEPMIGRDFMEKHGCRWDIGNHRIYFNGFEVDLLQPSRRSASPPAVSQAQKSKVAPTSGRTRNLGEIVPNMVDVESVNNRAVVVGKSKSKQRVFCKYCHLVSHLIGDCKKLKAKEARKANEQSFSSKSGGHNRLIKCAYCKQNHHITVCPKLKAKELRASQCSSNFFESQSSVKPEDECAHSRSTEFRVPSPERLRDSRFCLNRR